MKRTIDDTNTINAKRTKTEPYEQIVISDSEILQCIEIRINTINDTIHFIEHSVTEDSHLPRYYNSIGQNITAIHNHINELGRRGTYINCDEISKLINKIKKL